MSNGANLHTRANMFATSKAMIVEAPNWQPIRTFVEYAHSKPVGRFVSRKSRRAMTWEGFGERHLMRISEADGQFVRYLAQPHRLEIRVDHSDKPLLYFPDLRRDLKDGTIEIIEVKRTEKEIEADPDYAFKIAMAESVYAALGWKFRIIIAEEEIDVNPIYSNAKMICEDKFSLIGTRERLAIEEAFQINEALPYGRAIEIIASAADVPLERAQAVLHALVCTRRAAIDIRKKITRDSAVTKP
ncbi:hypothetical protein V1281_006413 [Nitrobacteraceae bacterium AZCC 2161]